MGTKNTLLDLNDHLFMQIERLNDDDLTGSQLAEEVERARAMTGLASQIVGTAGLMLKAVQINSDMETEGSVPRILIGDKKKGENDD
jgi:hypothetical protein